MLVCNYRVRCISFDHFEELNRWVRILKTHLTCEFRHFLNFLFTTGGLMILS
ncbi:hypothetical protein CLF_110718 [Clonorchis sinensis]|uniref:Uncharacterized protein n=1 Tax=Clonorchis sinensis TaxID=79923 RepID=G7YL30_CLOSI|nr:hypothetical protein CLF_110718 [Clonorchis sinensis]